MHIVSNHDGSFSVIAHAFGAFRVLETGTLDDCTAYMDVPCPVDGRLRRFARQVVVAVAG